MSNSEQLRNGVESTHVLKWSIAVGLILVGLLDTTTRTTLKVLNYTTARAEIAQCSKEANPKTSLSLEIPKDQVEAVLNTIIEYDRNNPGDITCYIQVGSSDEINSTTTLAINMSNQQGKTLLIESLKKTNLLTDPNIFKGTVFSPQ